jgi:hypothetical protein
MNEWSYTSTPYVLIFFMKYRTTLYLYPFEVGCLYVILPLQYGVHPRGPDF